VSVVLVDEATWLSLIEHPLRVTWLPLVVALPTAAVLGVVMRAIGPKVGALDHPDSTLKPHGRAVPYLGGLAVAGGIAAGLGVRGWPIAVGVSIALVAPVALGLLDDAMGIPPPARLALQVGLGVALVAGGARGALPGDVLAVGGAIVLYAAALNAVNMLDGMDGLAGGLAAASGAGIAAIALTRHRPGLVAVCIVGAAAGFLLHNLPPARLFLGDNGAYLLGAALAIAVLETGRQVPELAGTAGCLGVFLLDLVLSLLRRVTGRVPLHRGDRSHLYDQLRARGRSVWGTLGICLAAHAALVGSGIVAAQLSTAGALAVQGVVWAAAIAALFALGFVRYRRPAAVR
jgi:UDP-GlcNAc:undecaprenyl-phosphate/decaprenyl-phosphate GlcNAc-1-phosphate transferase